MAQISRLHAAEIANGEIIDADDLDDEFNQLVNESNLQDTRITAIESGTSTLSGTYTFSGVVSVTGRLNLSRSSDPTASVGDEWYNSTTDLYKGKTTAGGTTVFDMANGVNAQTGTTYTVLTGDRSKLVTFSNAAAVAVTLPQAASTGFATNYKFKAMNLGAGTVTITPTTSTIDGAASITLTTNQSIDIFSNETNYFTCRGRSTTPIFTLSFTSSDQTITAAGSLTLAHSLGVVPKFLRYVLVCQTGELGYSTNDVAETNWSSLGGNQGMSVVCDATNVNIRYGSTAATFDLAHKTTGVMTAATNANWKLRVMAWA